MTIYEDLKQKLGREPRYTELQAEVKRIKTEARPITRNSFSAEDDQFLRENWGSMTTYKLALALGRTRNSVAGHIYRMGLPAKAKHQTAKSVPKSKPLVHDKPSPPELTPPSTDHVCSIWDLTNKTCRWPIGEPSEFLYCGVPEANFPQEPYCGYHNRAQYNPNK